MWSQPSGKSRGHAVNSLEGIADDLTGLPFTLQDVKSEDGETPPPSNNSAIPSRMSLHDVTRAFQQVPSSSSSNDMTQRATPLSPPPTSSSVPRQPNFVYPAPSPNPNARPHYGGYPSPMMSHSPSPTMVYPSPVLGRMPMNGQPPMFNAPPGWIPGHPSQPQQHPGMMRPMGSPYPAQMMAYPSPGGPSMYVHHQPPNIQNQGPQQPGAGQGRGRGMMPPMSPAMQHVAAHNPMYPGSPVMMHPPPMPGHPYMNPMPAGRGQLRNDHPGASPIQHTPPHSQPGYTPVPSASFGRPGW